MASEVIVNPALNRRHALGMPAGSVRAAHVLGVVGIICAILLVPAKSIVAIPPYLIYLFFLILGHFFAAHGVTIASRSDPLPSPLYLPGGIIRILIIFAVGGAIAYKYHDDPAGLIAQYQASLDELKNQPFMPVLILGAFFVGVLIRGVVGRVHPPQIWQDFEAWISLLALIGLGIAALIHLVIVPNLPEGISMPLWESILGAVVAFYFGERS